MTKSAVRKQKLRERKAPKGSDKNGKLQPTPDGVSRVKNPPAPSTLQPILFTVDEAKVVLQALAQQWKNGQVTYPALGQVNVMAAAKVQQSGGRLDQDSGE